MFQNILAGLKSWLHLLTSRHLLVHTSCQHFQLQLWKLWQPNTLAVANSWTCSASLQSQSSNLGNLQGYFLPEVGNLDLLLVKNKFSFGKWKAGPKINLHQQFSVCDNGQGSDLDHLMDINSLLQQFFRHILKSCCEGFVLVHFASSPKENISILYCIKVFGSP